MKRCVEFIMGIVLLLAVFVLTGPFSSIWEEEAARTVSGGSEISAYKKELPVIVLDAGHGGRDPGKIGVNGALEKEINLALAQKVKALLEESGAAEEVILTREDDEGLYDETDSNKKAADLNERCRIIEESGADFVVSIHQNSYTDGSVSGPQVFYYKNSEEGKLLAEAVQERRRKDPFGPGQRKLLYAASCGLSHCHCRVRLSEQRGGGGQTGGGSVSGPAGRGHLQRNSCLYGEFVKISLGQSFHFVLKMLY